MVVEIMIPVIMDLRVVITIISQALITNKPTTTFRSRDTFTPLIFPLTNKDLLRTNQLVSYLLY